MKRLKCCAAAALLLTLLLCSACGKPASQTNGAVDQSSREITDMAGRTVKIPKTVQKVYSTGQPGIVMMVTLSPDKLLGWCMSVSQAEKDYIKPQYYLLPVLGLMQGQNNTVNKEELLKRAPDIILFMGEINAAAIETCDTEQNELGIPVVMVDFALDKLDKAYTFLGNILNESDRASKLSAYVKNALQYASETSASIPSDKKLSVYYAQSATGLQTSPPGASHSQVIDLVGGLNVAKLPVQGADNRITVNMEQVLAWNPQVILSSDTHTAQGSFSFISEGSEAWAHIDAVKSNRVYHVPSAPYDYLDMPPSVNRIIGIYWLGNKLYPEYFNYDIHEKIKEFYTLFYQSTPTDAMIDSLLS